MLASFLLTSAICYHQLNLHGTFIGISNECNVHISTFYKMLAISPVFQAAAFGGFFIGPVCICLLWVFNSLHLSQHILYFYCTFVEKKSGKRPLIFLGNVKIFQNRKVTLHRSCTHILYFSKVNTITFLSRTVFKITSVICIL